MSWLWVLAAGLVAFAALLYLSLYLRWEERQTSGLAFFGRPLSERRRIKAQVRRRSWVVRPIVMLLASLSRRRLTMPTFEYQGVSGPPRVSSPEVFARARDYQPRAEDVFVVTQMRCGTTWMQQIVYEIATRGHGESDRSERHLYAISPWIDAQTTVAIDAAPIVGDRPTRIIKCHLPVSLCPYSASAKYVYVTRHPVSCFASIVDYNRSLLGPVMPPVPVMLEWYCSEQMYWGSWPRHVDGWWRWAESRSNVLFVHFEEMKSDLAAVIDRVARLLGVALTVDERQRVIERCGFAYMQRHEEFFEMAPPTMFSVRGGKFLASGSATRHEDVTPPMRERIVRFCAEALRGAAYPVTRFYPDVADSTLRTP
jgi:hypothetical protein